MVIIDNVLTPAQVTQIREVLEQSRFEDGKATTGALIRKFKNNLQADTSEGKLATAAQTVLTALVNHEKFREYAIPRRILPPFFNRYDAGMYYKDHVDNAIMGSSEPMRADISLSVLLSAPDEYDGGELLIGGDNGITPVKPGSGAAVLYSSATIHSVAPVTRGTRYAAISWVQSLIRGAEQRMILSELSELGRWAHQSAPDASEPTRITRLRVNLMRMWSEI
ncbi:MAG: Fe2+-dependent dioxygenase [Gammaproteobacteria bacterium]